MAQKRRREEDWDDTGRKRLCQPSVLAIEATPHAHGFISDPFSIDAEPPMFGSVTSRISTQPFWQPNDSSRYKRKRTESLDLEEDEVDSRPVLKKTKTRPQPPPMAAIQLFSRNTRKRQRDSDDGAMDLEEVEPKRRKMDMEIMDDTENQMQALPPTSRKRKFGQDAFVRKKPRPNSLFECGAENLIWRKNTNSQLFQQ